MMPENAAGGEIIETLFGYMDSESMIQEFEHFVVRAMWSDAELLEEIEEELDDSGESDYSVLLQNGELNIDGKDIEGVIISVWSSDVAPEAESLPPHLNRDRHARFLKVEDDLITGMYMLPTVH